jgi:hypothetical protein
VTVPPNQVKEATGPAGAVVTFPAPTTTNGGDGPACTSAPTAGLTSGSTFPLGVTTITCTSTNPNGSDSKSFTVTVQDTTPPALTTPPAQTVEAVSASGAVVTYTAATATDIVTGSRPVSCSKNSGSVFPVGATTVNCTASDGNGNTGAKSFTVTVRDTTPPVVTVPANITLDATSSAGAVATFTASATDTVGPASPAVTCTPPSDSTFPVGTTAVTCTASDASGNVGSAGFSVTINPFSPPPSGTATPPPPSTQGSGGTGPLAKKPNVGPKAAALAKKIKGSKLRSRDKSALSGLLARPACSNLGKFVSRVKAVQKVRASRLSAGTARSWVSAANAMRTTLGC